MKIFHLSDLHIGKKVCEHSMLEDQKYIFKQIVERVKEESPKAVILAGDIYDNTQPGNDAVEVFDNFLNDLVDAGTLIFVISGNHDSDVKVAFGNRLMKKSGVHISPAYNGEFTPFTLQENGEEVDIWLLPFITRAKVRSFLEEAEGEEIINTEEAVKKAISLMKINPSRKNILVAHQFITGAKQSESEIHVGTTDNVNVNAFKDFDYVALGHIHKPQNISFKDGKTKVRYSGTPLKYSLSEINNKNSISVIEIENDNLELREIPLNPLRDMVKLSGNLEAFLSNKNVEENKNKYVYFELTDDTDSFNIVPKLREKYRYFMELKNKERENTQLDSSNENGEKKSPLEHLKDFFKEQNQKELNDEAVEFVNELIQKIWSKEA